MTPRPSYLALASALLCLGAFAPFNAVPLLFVCLAPLLIRLGEPGVRSFRCGYGFGIVFGLGQFFWLTQLAYRWTGSFVLALVPLVLATVLYAIYFGLIGWLVQRCWLLRMPWLIPLVWAGVEAFRSYIPVLAFPWGLLASPLWHYPALMQSAHWLTIFGSSAFVVLVNTALAVWYRERSFAAVRPLIAGIAVVALVPVAAEWIPVNTTPLRVTAGQPGVDLAFGDPKPNKLAVEFNVAQIQEQARNEKSQLLVLPEGLIHTPSTMPPKIPFTVSSSLPIVFGGQRGDEPAYQSAFAYDGAWSVADKTRLVIFGEFVPGRNVIPFLDQFHLPTGDISAGTRVSSLTVNQTIVGPLVCFEGLFPDLGYRQTLNGAQVLAVMSMDDWFMGSNAPDQLRAGSVWRAVETGRPVIRAASTGFSLIVDRFGNVLGDAPTQTTSAITREIQITSGGAPWWLPVFPLLSVAVCLGLIAFPVLVKSTRKPASSAATS